MAYCFNRCFQCLHHPAKTACSITWRTSCWGVLLFAQRFPVLSKPIFASKYSFCSFSFSRSTCFAHVYTAPASKVLAIPLKLRFLRRFWSNSTFSALLVAKIYRNVMTCDFEKLCFKKWCLALLALLREKKVNWLV